MGWSEIGPGLFLEGSCLWGVVNHPLGRSSLALAIAHPTIILSYSLSSSLAKNLAKLQCAKEGHATESFPSSGRVPSRLQSLTKHLALLADAIERGFG